MIHCYQTTDGDYAASLNFWRVLNDDIYFDTCPLRAIWLALRAEVRTK